MALDLSFKQLIAAAEDGAATIGQPTCISIDRIDEAGGNAAANHNLRSLPKRELPLGIVLDACPNMRWLIKRGEIRHWKDLLAAAELARPMLGISPSAWREAREVLGDQQAAITLAAIHQKADQINSAGGYLRSLTDRAKDGKFSVWPMIMALLRAKLDGSTPTRRPRVVPPDSSRGNPRKPGPFRPARNYAPHWPGGRNDPKRRQE